MLTVEIYCNMLTSSILWPGVSPTHHFCAKKISAIICKNNQSGIKCAVCFCSAKIPVLFGYIMESRFAQQKVQHFNVLLWPPIYPQGPCFTCFILVWVKNSIAFTHTYMSAEEWGGPTLAHWPWIHQVKEENRILDAFGTSAQSVDLHACGHDDHPDWRMYFPGIRYAGKTWICCQSTTFQQTGRSLSSNIYVHAASKAFLHTQGFVLLQVFYSQHVLLGHYPISALLNKPRNSWNKGFSPGKNEVTENSEEE